ncbi:MAG: hypothetical protein RLY89_2290 [Bacteroidota bacterium]|jgi:heat shock protein HslJ
MKHFIWMICFGLIGFSACKTAQTTKNKSLTLTDKYWRLTTLNDLAISKDPAATREMHMILKQEGLKINGNAGCNSFFGSFELKADNGISFGKMGSTMMACKDMQLESQFLEALTKANTYSIIGNQLTISKDNAVLAKFEGRGLR